jgi:hypothetical protein
MAISLTVEIGERYGVEAVSWGHAGDGNLHSNSFSTRPAMAAHGRMRLPRTCSPRLSSSVEPSRASTGRVR